METPTPQNGGGFRSRRSYPSLHHISLTPLTNRFPIDDEDEAAPRDYFSPREERSADTPTRTSYLSSFSVPGTPGVLSHSRSNSRPRPHSRSKSSSRIHRSDSNLHTQDEPQPLHHHSHSHHHNHSHSHSHNHSHNHSHPPNSAKKARTATPHRDAEWMLRAGIALASSTREEKGQSWLVKRESSTNLVSENTVTPTATHPPSRPSRSRSGRSTPAVYSRRGSRSRAASRRNSRPDLSMTGLGAMSPRLRVGAGAGAIALGTGAGAGVRDDGRVLPDFVDEQIRAEMASIQQFEDRYAYASAPGSASGSEAGFDSDESDYTDDDDDEEIDEQELQRLTRERGFGLGGWIDRMVEWTLFGVEDLPLVGGGIGQPGTGQTANVSSSSEGAVLEESMGENQSVSGLTDDNDGLSADESVVYAVMEKPGGNGGWEDAGWLIRAMKRALL